MASTISYVNATTAPAGRVGTPSRACPDCQGLECLCRPRFFAGQLLTEEELNRLDRYIVGKSRLHNRYLNGWGVVCGLDVTCDGCGAGVQVSTGYALGPCGDDIVVCRPVTVDVCALIGDCAKRSRPNCDPPNTQGTGCLKPTQDWILAIRYHETPSRGITPLRGGVSSCGCGGGGGQAKSGGCGCGGGCGGGGTKAKSGGCGCGGGGAARGASTGGGRMAAARGNCGCDGGGGANGTVTSSSCATPRECAPTVVCEDFSFEVYKAPTATDSTDDTRSRRSEGAMVDRFNACFSALEDFITPAPATTDKQTRADWVNATKDGLQDYFLAHPPYACQLTTRVANIVSPTVTMSNAQFDTVYTTATTQLAYIGIELMMSCLCTAFEPPCPAPADDDRVPLALITVDCEDCRVLRVCNWSTARKIATTIPNLQYWLSILPYGRMLREGLERMCCKWFAALDPEPSNPKYDDQGNPTQPPSSGTSGGKATIVGTVTNQAGQRLDSAQVSVAGTTRSGLTDAQGRYRITDVPAGTQTVNAARAGYDSASQTVQLPAGQTTTVDFTLNQAGANAVVQPMMIAMEPMGAGAGDAAAADTATADTGAAKRRTAESLFEPTAPFRGSAATMAQSKALMALAFDSLSSRESMPVERILFGALGGEDEQGEPLLSRLQSDNLLRFIALDQMVKPTLRNTMPSKAGGVADLLRMASVFMGAGSTERGPATEDPRVSELQETVRKQQAAIDALNAAIKNR